MIFTKTKTILFILLLINSVHLTAQLTTPKKYPSLLWEITGNGLTKPSYLFGTMHVSNKLVFHLSDSFFYAIKKCDVVGLELNSDTWQQQMIDVERQKLNYFKFYGNKYDYSNYNYGKTTASINQYTCRLENNYIDVVKYAIPETPFILNALLYRTKEYKQDFEENTFLDLYIYQIGKKLGKKSAGMETIYTMEKYTTEAELDRINEKETDRKKTSEDDMPTMTQDEAYRNGDLDMLDSLGILYETSKAFTEKFLYQRNDVQAYSMDTIMKKGQSLFVGVGAAHLPGKRGVIEILRKMGYKLRPIKMSDRDANQRDAIDKIKVPVAFIENKANDEFFTVKLPGKLYTRPDNTTGSTTQYADMANGTYYMVTRVPTFTNYFNVPDAEVAQQVDSLLYENVPGKIIKKIAIVKNGYKGFDITNKTRRGDIQRYNIIITPFEILIFKMSGTENYVLGKEAQDFFNSITIKTYPQSWNTYTNQLAQYTCYLPHQPHQQTLNGINLAVAYDSNEKVLYSLQDFNLINNDFSVADTFNLMLMEESYVGNIKKLKTNYKKYVTENGLNILKAAYTYKDTTMQVQYIINGYRHYVISAKGKDEKLVLNNKVMPSFKVLAYPKYMAQLYVDTLLKFRVVTPYKPILNDSLKTLLDRINTASKYEKDTYKSWGNYSSMAFENDTTGEVINVNYYKAGKYETVPDSLQKYVLYLDSVAPLVNNSSRLAKIYDSLTAIGKPSYFESDFYKKYTIKQDEIVIKNGARYRQTAYTNKGTTKLNRTLDIWKNDFNYVVTTTTDTSNSSTFINTFFNTFEPLENQKGTSYYVPKIDTFFNDYYSKDSTTRKLAKSALLNFEFTKKDLPLMLAAYRKLTIADKDYFTTKIKWIAAVAKIKDTTLASQKMDFLKTEYEKTVDTSLFQNAILVMLVKLNTSASFALFKKYLLQDPPVSVMDNEYSNDNTNSLFGQSDSLELISTLYPDILQLTIITEYKNDVENMLLTLVDSNKILPANYELYSTKLLFDAKIALKKKLIEIENKVKNDMEKETDNVAVDYTYAAYRNNDKGGESLTNYVKLLLPFYTTNTAIPNYINKLWQLKDDAVKQDLLFIMLKAKKPIPDTLLTYFANKEDYRGNLYYQLQLLKLGNMYPTQFATQAILAKAFLYTTINEKDKLDSTELATYYRTTNYNYNYNKGYNSYDYKKTFYNKPMDSICLLQKQTVTINTKTGVLYIYKYRTEKDDKWRFAFSGLQPLNEKNISYSNIATEFTEVKLKDTEPLEEQLQELIKVIKYNNNPNSKYFFETKRKQYRYEDY